MFLSVTKNHQLLSTKDACKALPAVGWLCPSGDDDDGVDDDDNTSQRADWKRKPGLSILNSKSSLCLPLLLIVMGSG